MASPAPQKVPYSLHTDASSLFRFLKDTFFKMPKAVQVFGWIVFLLLFVFLVLYPLLGITYYEGRVVSLTIGQDKKPHMTPGAGIRIHKEGTTTTNEQGEFIVGIHTPDIPFVKIDFDFSDGSETETVSIPTPAPFVSLFNPNRRKIFYVPSSTVQAEDGLYIQHYFLDEAEARKALNILAGSSSSLTDARPADSGQAIGHLAPDTVYASSPPSSNRSYTLRLDEIRIKGRQETTEVYFGVKIDGQSTHIEGLPDAQSPEIQDVSVLGDTPTRFDALSVPISNGARHVEISMFERKSFFQRDPLIGTVGLDINGDKVTKAVALAGGGMELTVKLLPAVALACTSVAGQTGKNIIAVLWLDIDRNDLKSVDSVRYDLGANFEQRYLATPLLTPSTYYATGLSLGAPQPMKARVEFTGGDAVSLSTSCDRASTVTDTAAGHYVLARAYSSAGNQEEALKEIQAARAKDKEFMPAVMIEGSILAKLGKFDSALADYDEALKASPDDPQVLNSYAWTIADILPGPRTSQLEDAKRRAEQAVRINPNPNNLDTLGWVEFKLLEYDSALKALQNARDMEAKQNLGSTAWQTINYHLGKVYLALGRRPEAKQAFQTVINYDKQHTSSNAEYVQTANAELKKLQ